MTEMIVKIVKVDYFGDEEAEVLFEVNHCEYWAFSYPCDFIEGETVNVEFSMMIETKPLDMFWNHNSDKRQELVQQVDNKKIKWAYDAYGCIIGIDPVMVNCGGFVFELGDTYMGTSINIENSIGKYVYFSIIRLDIYRAES